MLQPPCRLLHNGLHQLDPMEVFIGSTKQYYCMRCISHKSSCIVNGQFIIIIIIIIIIAYIALFSYSFIALYNDYVNVEPKS